MKDTCGFCLLCVQGIAFCNKVLSDMQYQNVLSMDVYSEHNTLSLQIREKFIDISKCPNSPKKNRSAVEEKKYTVPVKSLDTPSHFFEKFFLYFYYFLHGR